MRLELNQEYLEYGMRYPNPIDNLVAAPGVVLPVSTVHAGGIYIGGGMQYNLDKTK